MENRAEKCAEKRQKNGRDERGRFLPGNPGGGRPPIPAELRELAQAAAPRAIEIALELMETATNERVRLAAAEVLLDRGYGKPAQAVDVTSAGEQIQPIRLVEVVKSVGTDSEPAA